MSLLLEKVFGGQHELVVSTAFLGIETISIHINHQEIDNITDQNIKKLVRKCHFCYRNCHFHGILTNQTHFYSHKQSNCFN